MKKVGFYITVSFTSYLIGHLVWVVTIFSQKPLFGSEYLENFILILFFTFSGIFGLISGLILMKIEK